MSCKSTGSLPDLSQHQWMAEADETKQDPEGPSWGQTTALVSPTSFIKKV